MNFRSAATRLAGVTAILLVLSGCGAGGGDGVNYNANVNITRIDVEQDSTYQPGDSLTVSYDIYIVGITGTSVTIDFYMLHADSLGYTETDEDVEHAYFMGSVTADSGSRDSQSLNADLVVPSDVAQGGEYWVVAYVDPNDEIDETNENDNHPNLDNKDYPRDTILVELHSDHDFIIAGATITDNVVILDIPETGGDAGLTINQSHIIGHIDAVYHGSAIGLATLQGDVMIGGDWQSVKLWNTESKQYVNQLPIVFAYNGDEHYFGIDILLSNAQVDALLAAYDSASENELTLRFSLEDSTTSIEQNNTNNSQEITVPLYFFNSSRSILSARAVSSITKFEKSYSKSYGDKGKFAVGIDLYGKAQLDLLDIGGVIDASGEVDVWIFNAKNDLFSIKFHASAYADGLNTGYSTEIVIFNAKAFEEERFVAKFEKSFEKSWEEEKTLVEARFAIGPVPMSVSAGVSGELGFDLSVGYAVELYAKGDASLGLFHTNFKAFAEGGIDLLIASGGVIAELTLINNIFRLDSSVDLSLASDATPVIGYGIDLTDDLDVISGKFGLFAEVSGIKWCKKWGIPYPCGTKHTTYYLWLYQTPSVFNKSWTIYSNSGSINL